jgi:hypothetical protein
MPAFDDALRAMPTPSISATAHERDYFHAVWDAPDRVAALAAADALKVSKVRRLLA